MSLNKSINTLRAHELPHFEYASIQEQTASVTDEAPMTEVWTINGAALVFLIEIDKSLKNN